VSGGSPSRRPKQRHSPPPIQPLDRVGLAWFDATQYQRLLEVAADREKLHDTYEAWLKGAEALVKRLPIKPVLISVQIDALLAWCREREMPLDSAARSKYAAEMVPRLECDDVGAGGALAADQAPAEPAEPAEPPKGIAATKKEHRQ